MRERDFNPRMLRITGWLGIGGCVAAVVADVIGIVVYQPYNPVSQSISSLAAGRWAWIMDTGLVLLVIGMLAATVGLLAWRRGTLWVLGCLFVMLMAAAILTIALVSDYAKQDNPGIDVHEYAFYSVLILGVLGPLCLAPGLLGDSAGLGLWSLATAFLWAILAPFYWSVPADWIGAFERGFVLIGVLWLAAVSNLLRKQGRAAHG